MMSDSCWYKKEWLWRVVLFSLMALLLWMRFPDMLPNARGKLIEPYGDGFKAYTVIIYHAKYDSSYTHFGGMNYPYGDHVVPAATQPILSNSLKWLKDHHLDLTDYIPDIVHYSMLISVMFCAFFLYLIFRRLEIPAWYSLLVATGITFLAPQFQRIASHYGLAHPEVLPLLFYLLMRYAEKPGLKYSGLVAGVVWFYAQIHFYYFAISILTISSFFFFWVVQKWDWQQIPRYLLHFSIQVLLPFLYFLWWVNGLDTVDDRPGTPWGFFYYRGLPEGTFISDQQPHLSWLRNEILHVGHVGFEAENYLGLVTVIGLGFLLFRWFRNPLRVKPVSDIAGKGRYLNAIFYTGLVLMLYGFGLPFVISGLEWLLEYAGPFRQFRSVGRFVWVFYFVSNMVVFSWLYHRLKGKRRAWMLWMPAILILAFEAYHLAMFRDLRLNEIDRFAAGRRFTDLPDIRYDDYQGILGIPLCHIGSSQLEWEIEGFIIQNVFAMSIQTGLPAMSAMLTRTSLSQTFNQYQLVMEPYRLPALLEDLPNQKPLLVVFDVLKYEAAPERYQHLLKYMRLVYGEDRLRLYELPVSAFAQMVKDRQEEVRDRIDSDSTLNRLDGYYYTDSVLNFVYESYDQRPDPESYWGKGAYRGIMEEENVFLDGPLPQPAKGPYSLHVWLYIGKDRYSGTKLKWEEYLPATGESIQKQSESAFLFITLLDNGWALLTMDFTPLRDDSYHRFMMQNKPLMRAPLLLDEVLILPSGQELFRKMEGYIWLNDRWYPYSEEAD